ncbi:MAG: hypothetical protein ABW168_03715 [Sedimenticola sp.]
MMKELNTTCFLTILKDEFAMLPLGSDYGDIGNLVGIAAAKAAQEFSPDTLEEIKEEFFAGVKHGFSLVDGTH